MKLWSRFVAAAEAWSDFDPWPADEESQAVAEWLIAEQVWKTNTYWRGIQTRLIGLRRRADDQLAVRTESARMVAHMLAHDAEVWELRARGLGWKEPPR